MKPVISLILYFLIIGTISCKKTPDFVTSNNFDPYSENYLMPKVTNFKAYLDRIYVGDEPSIILDWDVEEGHYEGVLIQKYNPKTNSFEDLKKIPRYNSFIDDIDSRQTLNPRYLAFTYVNTINGRRLSKDSAEAEVNTRIFDFSPVIANKNTIQLNWKHNFTIDTARVIIERSTDNKSTFSQVAELEMSVKAFQDDIQLLSGNSLYYRIHMETELESSDTLYTEEIVLQPKQPYNLEIVSTSPNEIKLVTQFPKLYDSFELTLSNQNGTIVSTFSETEVKGDSLFFQISGLSFDDSKYVIRLSSILKGSKSDPLIKELTVAPALELLTYFKSTSDIYNPSFNSTTNELIYLAGGSPLRIERYSFQTNQRNIVTSSSYDVDRIYYDQASNTIYGHMNSVLKRWDIDGNELENHPLPNENISQIKINSTYNLAFLKVFQHEVIIFDLDNDEIIERYTTGNSQMNISENGEYLSVTSGAGFFDLFEVISTGVVYQGQTHPQFRIHDILFANNSIYVWNSGEAGLLQYSLPSINLTYSTSINIEGLNNVEVISKKNILVAIGEPHYSPNFYFLDLQTGEVLNHLNIEEEYESYPDMHVSDDAKLIYDAATEKLIIVSNSDILSFNIANTWKLEEY